MLTNSPDINKNIHRPAADHSFFARFIRRECEVMQTGGSAAHRFARFRPDLCFDAATADRARGLAVFKKKHLGAASLRSRTARVRNRGDHDAFAAPVRVGDQTIEITLGNCSHNSVGSKQSAEGSKDKSRCYRRAAMAAIFKALDKDSATVTAWERAALRLPSTARLSSHYESRPRQQHPDACADAQPRRRRSRSPARDGCGWPPTDQAVFAPDLFRSPADGGVAPAALPDASSQSRPTSVRCFPASAHSQGLQLGPASRIPLIARRAAPCAASWPAVLPATGVRDRPANAVPLPSDRFCP